MLSLFLFWCQTTAVITWWSDWSVLLGHFIHSFILLHELLNKLQMWAAIQRSDNHQGRGQDFKNAADFFCFLCLICASLFLLFVFCKEQKNESTVLQINIAITLLSPNSPRVSHIFYLFPIEEILRLIKFCHFCSFNCAITLTGILFLQRDTWDTSIQ